MKKNRLFIKIVCFSLFLSVINVFSQNTANSSFELEIGKKYIISAWVNEGIEVPKLNYTSSQIEISFGSTTSPFLYTPSGNIIDGWQKIIGEFMVPLDAEHFSIKLVSNLASGSSYFDDIRILPVNGSMKSFVYDPVTQRLMAELDENNYATFYEYDREGGLIRIKKETEQGIYTIQETRSGNSKKTSGL